MRLEGRLVPCTLQFCCGRLRPHELVGGAVATAAEAQVDDCFELMSAGSGRTLAAVMLQCMGQSLLGLASTLLSCPGDRHTGACHASGDEHAARGLGLPLRR